MSAPAEITTERAGRSTGDLPGAAILVLGASLLLVRPFALGRPGSSFILATMYIGLGAICLAVSPAAPEPRLLQPVLAFGIGASALFLGGLAAGPRLPAPVAPDAFVLNSLAAVSEEAFFRRFLYDRLARFGPAAAILVTSILFALIHVPLYGMPALWVDLGAGLVLSWQRWATGRWTTPAATHVLANLLAVIR
jgi:membrane protease YdiL (CAAX protease family)